MTDTTESTPTSTDTALTLRLWPALVFMVIGFGASLGFSQLGSTNIDNLKGLIIGPMGMSVCIVLWWIVASRIAKRDRVVGIILLGVSLGVLFLLQQDNAAFLVLLAIPYLAYGVVIVFAVTRKRSWVVQRRLAVIYLVLCVAILSTMRMESFGGDLSPTLQWRWASSVEVTSAVSPGAVAVLPTALESTDWPGFRGPNRDSHLAGVSFPTDWTTPPRELWRKPVGVGWSSIVAIGEYIFTQEQRGTHEVVVCYAAETGKEIWVNSVDAYFVDRPTGSGPRATPTYRDGKLYVQGATGILQCLDAKTGNMIWQRDLIADTGAKLPEWGFASSPLLVDDSVIQFSGGNDDSSVVAYQQTTGDLAWKSGKGTISYSSAHLVTLEGTPQVLAISNFGIQSFAPKSGAVLWEHSWEVRMNPRVVQPVVTEDAGILVGTAAGMGTRRLGLSLSDGKWKVSEQWTTKRFRPYFNDYILHKGYCYGFDGNRLMCIDVKTGERQWKGDRIGGQLLFIRDMEMLLILTEKGEVMLINADPKEYTIVSRFKAISGKTWNHPIIAHGKLYVRNAEEMACFALEPLN